MSIFILLLPIPLFCAAGCLFRWLETQSSRAAAGFKYGIYGLIICAFLSFFF